MPHLIILCKEKGTRVRKFNSSKENSYSYKVTCFCVQLFGLVNKIKVFLAFAIDIIIIIIIIVIIIFIVIITIVTCLVFQSLSV